MTPRTLGTLALLAALSTAHAARPLQTEEAEAVAPGRCELDGEHARAKADGETTRGMALDLACGLFEGTQANLGWGRERGAGGTAQAAGVGFKTGLWKGAGEEAPRLSLAGALDWGRAPAAGWQRESAELKLAFTAPALESLWHVNLGHRRNAAGHVQSTTWGLAWELEALPAGPLAWAPMAEFTGDDRRQTWFNAGIRLTAIAERLWLDLSSQRQTAGGKSRGLTVGFKLAF